ncbi:MAG: cysteine desulfurase [Parcubacteria group bacterium]|nr:cysteine desulfurase [Parcubacteria group bacterium]
MRIYLDYAATTPVDPEVEKAMQPYFGKEFGNPGSLHQFGQAALAAVDESRASIARFLNTSSREVIFTGSATEANNLALRGTIRSFWWRYFKERKSDEKPVMPHIVTSTVEHESILETCRDIERRGAAEVSYIGVDRYGFIDVDELKSALRPETVLVSVMYANNEIGTIQQITEITEVIRNWKSSTRAKFGAGLEIGNSIYPLFHTDAAQALQFLDCDVKKLGVDFMTISAHKIYGPKGIGALYAKQFLNSNPHTPSSIITGGGQEHGFRSGTENVPAIVGFAKAVELVARYKERESSRIRALREELWRGILQIASRAERNTPVDSGEGSLPVALPHILSVAFPGVSGEELLFLLDREGVAVSTGSACQARAVTPSHVLKALGVRDEVISATIRFSLGRGTSSQDIAQVHDVLKHIFIKR